MRGDPDEGGSGEANTGAASTLQQEGSSAAPSRQREASAGSYSSDDSDRPQWSSETTLEQVYDYPDAKDRYAYSKLKGRNSDGQKVFLTGRLLGGSDLQIAKAEWPREFYSFPGLTNYLKGAGDNPDYLYRLPELLNNLGTRPDDLVVICEGEKDADTCNSLGLIATTNPNGALRWPPEFNAMFEGRDVVILIDNDDNGRKRGMLIHRSLSGIARSIKVIGFPGLGVNCDVTDFVEAGGTEEQLLQIIADAAELEPTPDLDRNDEGQPRKTPENVRRALALMGVSVRYDEFASRYLVDGLSGFGPVLDDAALTRMRLTAEEEWRLAIAKERWADIVTDRARYNSFHPVRDYLHGLNWDGTRRLDTWLSEYGGADDNEYVRAVASICMVAAVRRVRKPGCKFDEMLVLESEQGTEKSTALSVLAVHEDWFADDLPVDADSKVLMERVAGRWIVELAELKGMKRSAVEHVKGVLSRRIDKARLAYGRMVTEQPRQCIFFGTTNDTAYLRDMTGNRRFWPVKVRRFDIAALRRDRDQIWAEAACREAEGESIRLPPRLWSVAGDHQSSREVGDPFYEVLSERLDGQAGKVRASDIWEVVGLGEVGQRNQDHNVRLNAAMQKLGWRRPKSKLRFGGPPQSAWVKGDDGAMAEAFVEVPRDLVIGSGRPF